MSAALASTFLLSLPTILFLLPLHFGPKKGGGKRTSQAILCFSLAVCCALGYPFAFCSLSLPLSFIFLPCFSFYWTALLLFDFCQRFPGSASLCLHKCSTSPRPANLAKMASHEDSAICFCILRVWFFFLFGLAIVHFSVSWSFNRLA